MTFALRFRAHSEVGRIRKNNQDAGYASPTMLLVADGMGGAAAGDLASAVAATEAARGDAATSGEEMLTHIRGIVERANQKLSELVDADPTLDGMGTTFCGAMFDGDSIGIAHIGDSRGYLLRDGQLTQLTHDHSWVQSLIDEGRLTPEQAATHPHRSLILRVLNGHTSMVADYELVDLELGDRLLFCSDGLSGMIDDATIRELLSEPDLDKAVDDLAAAANRSGGHDNITVVVAEVAEPSPALARSVPQLVGSAVEREIPDVAELAADFADSQFPAVTEPDAVPDEEDEAEKARYAPEERQTRWPLLVAALVVVAALVGGAIWGTGAYARSRYFIAEADGEVAIYNGLPGSLLGYRLNELTQRTGIQVADLPRFYQRAVNNTIGVGNLAEAQSTATELASLARRCVEAREARNAPATPAPTPTPSPSGLSTDPPNYPTYLAPITPTATEEAAPEAC